ncbi:MAG: DUF4843 domain-containing protein [Odoribacter sp.]|nr:DUF4843 domain-containing protein [Odoribacter sp.]
MVKNILYICLLAWAFCSCEQKDSFPYTEKAGIYFYVPDVKDGESENPNALKKEIEFNFRKTGVYDSWVFYRDLVYGDSLKSDTVRLPISLLGAPSDQSREYHLKAIAVEDDNQLPVTEIIFTNPYILEANAVADTAVIVIPRPLHRGEYAVVITFDTSTDFEGGIEQRDNYQLFITDRYPRPSGWNDATSIFGEYSEEKYAFFVSTFHVEYKSWDEYDISLLYRLRAALEAYNAAHPDNPKDFTFPEKN